MRSQQSPLMNARTTPTEEGASTPWKICMLEVDDFDGFSEQDKANFIAAIANTRIDAVALKRNRDTTQQSSTRTSQALRSWVAIPVFTINEEERGKALQTAQHINVSWHKARNTTVYEYQNNQLTEAVIPVEKPKPGFFKRYPWVRDALVGAAIGGAAALLIALTAFTMGATLPILLCVSIPVALTVTAVGTGAATRAFLNPQEKTSTSIETVTPTKTRIRNSGKNPTHSLVGARLPQPPSAAPTKQTPKLATVETDIDEIVTTLLQDNAVFIFFALPYSMDIRFSLLNFCQNKNVRDTFREWESSDSYVHTTTTISKTINTLFAHNDELGLSYKNALLSLHTDNGNAMKKLLLSNPNLCNALYNGIKHPGMNSWRDYYLKNQDNGNQHNATLNQSPEHNSPETPSF